MAVLALLAAAAWLTAQSTGEEPPIRVKNGSLDIELLAKSGRVWKNVPSHDDQWQINDGTLRRQNEQFEVVVGHHGGSCDDTVSPVGSPVRLEYSDGAWASLAAKGNKTVATTSTAANQTFTANGVMLTHGTPHVGFLKKISVSGHTLCTFTNARQLTSLALLD